MPSVVPFPPSSSDCSQQLRFMSTLAHVCIGAAKGVVASLPCCYHCRCNSRGNINNNISHRALNHKSLQYPKLTSTFNFNLDLNSRRMPTCPGCWKRPPKLR